MDQGDERNERGEKHIECVEWWRTEIGMEYDETLGRRTCGKYASLYFSILFSHRPAVVVSSASHLFMKTPLWDTITSARAGLKTIR
jgi:hypothetical protein